MDAIGVVEVKGLAVGPFDNLRHSNVMVAHAAISLVELLISLDEKRNVIQVL